MPISNDTESHTALTLYPYRLLMLTGVSQRHVLQSPAKARADSKHSAVHPFHIAHTCCWKAKLAGQTNQLVTEIFWQEHTERHLSLSIAGKGNKNHLSLLGKKHCGAGGVLQVVDMTSSGSWALWMYMTVAQVYKAIITGLCFTSVFICISNSAPNAKKVGCVLRQLLSA